MKPTFHHSPVNDPFDDPVVYVRVLREGTAMLFDAGDLSRLAVRDLLKLTDVFITHMHIDHFVGADTIIRALLRREAPVTFHGPEGITACIQGKLRGYTWNLISEYPVEIRVVEVGGETIRRSSYRANEEFVVRDDHTEDRTWGTQATIMENDLLSVKAVVLDHGIPSLGYSIHEKFHINIDKDALDRRGLEVGPWLSALKKAIRSGAMRDPVETGKGGFTPAELQEVFTITRGQKITYVMDTLPSDENVRRITEFAGGSDTLYIEAYFLHEDIERARERCHLTAAIAGRIAREAGVGDLQLLHFSPRYQDRPGALREEAMREFRR